MKKNNIKHILLQLIFVMLAVITATASSHREAPLISNDPLADNVDVYAFRSPDDPNTITLIATYVPFQLPHGGPNYYSFGENIRYEIHVDNDASVVGDEVTYRFTFNIENQDPTTFFNIRLGLQNQKATYNLERSMDGGQTFQMIIEGGIVPPNNIGQRSIESAVGLNTTYDALFNGAITNATTGEKVFAGPSDDPFFVDLGGIFDLGDAPRQNGTPVDGVACYNVSTIAIQVPINTLLKSGSPQVPANILDPNYVIGVWASASRPSITTISSDGEPEVSGDWVQVSRLGMPLTNEAIIPIGYKDFWNAITPYEELGETEMDEFFYNPELALYMDDAQFGTAVPAFNPLRIQTASLGTFDFRNGADGVSALAGGDLTGTAFEAFGDLLLIPGKPRSVDLWPIFHTGVPNAIPYQLATGKEGNPLAAGKPFINNFLPNGGDMLRLNMAVPVTPRTDPNFSSLGLIQAAAIGLTVAPFNATADLEFIPNMDGFPNGRRLEDDVTRIELQAVGGVVLAAIGLWYDDYDPMTSPSPVTEDLLGVLGYTTGVEANDRPFTTSFPFVAQPRSGTGDCSGEIQQNINPPVDDPTFKLFVSSNTEGLIGIYSYDEDGNEGFESFVSEATDADGIRYDEENDVLYQLNRSGNVINAYSDVIENLSNGDTPELTATSTSDFINGREIAVRNGKLVVAQDANDANGMTNKFVVYDVSPTSITFDKEITSTINLWGITFIGNSLFAIQDNSNNVAVYNNFLDAPSGSITPDNIVSVDAMVRTHGLTYEASGDVLILTDVADGTVATDGAIVIIENWTSAAADGNISDAEQVRIEGASTTLGNPVDVAYDVDAATIYVAERANEGGKVLTFGFPSTGGDIAPVSSNLYPGASAVYLSDCVNGNGDNEMEDEPVGVVFYGLEECRSFGSDNSNFDFSEFTAEYPNTIDCANISAGNVFRTNPTSNGHSCTPGVDGTVAMCVGSMASCTYNAGSDKAIKFEVTISPDANSDGVRLSSLSFYEKAPETYTWIAGASGDNNYPTQYGVRVLLNGSEIYTQSDIATTTEWTLETFDFTDLSDFVITEESTLEVQLLGYCPVGNGAEVSAWDVDELFLNATCAVPSERSVAGSIVNVKGDLIENVVVSINSILPEYPRTSTTDDQGLYAFSNVVSGSDYMISASKEGSYNNGVSTLDLVLIQRHLLGLKQLDSPYDLIAADVNGDKKLKTSDLLMLRKLILGIISEVPDNKNWKFINKKQVLTMQNAFDYDENIRITNLLENRSSEDYIAVKTGDVNGSASSNFTKQGSVSTRSSKNIQFFVQEQKVNAGETVQLEVTSDNFDMVSGFQFTFDHAGFELVDLEAGVLSIDLTNVAVVSNERLAMSWAKGKAVSFNDEVLFTLVLRANKNAGLSSSIDINDEFVKTESYVGEDLNVAGIELVVRKDESNIGETILFENVPNPFSSITTISFYLENAGMAEINVFDTQGRVLKTINSQYNAGKHFIKIDKADLDATSGILYYQLKTNTYSATRKMIMI